MTATLRRTIPLLLVLGCRTAIAQTPAPPSTQPPAPVTPLGPQPGPMNRQLIVIDPAHGGADTGARIGDSLLEKDITLALAFKLRSLLTARGFTVIMTRDAELSLTSTGGVLSLDTRAGLANHNRGVACLLLHATGAGTGVHLYSSELNAAPLEAVPLPWLTAQAAWVAESQHLQREMVTALGRASIAAISSQASVRPVDFLTCPALVVELAPETDDANSINNADYQQRVANTLAGALVFWPQQTHPPLRQPASTHSGAATGAAPTPPPAGQQP